MTSMVLLVLQFPPPPPPLLRHPAVRRATAPRMALAARLDLMRMCDSFGHWLGRRRLPGQRTEGAGGGRRDRGGQAWADRGRHRSTRGGVAGHPEAALGGEDVRLVRVDLDVDRRRPSWAAAGIDAHREQLVAGSAPREVCMRAVGVGVRAEFLDDDDLEREALALADEPTASGRKPSVAVFGPRGPARPSSRAAAGTTGPPRSAPSPSRSTSTRFIAGEPMNPATKTLSGLS